jgi:hypothetical protein
MGAGSWNGVRFAFDAPLGDPRNLIGLNHVRRCIDGRPDTSILSFSTGSAVGGPGLGIWNYRGVDDHFKVLLSRTGYPVTFEGALYQGQSAIL